MTVNKNLYKKGLFAIMAVMMTSLFLLSCGSNPSAKTGNLQETKAEEDLITVGFSQIGAESDWRLACTESVESAFTTENGFNLIFDDGQQKQENQLKAIREFIDMDVDYIILDPITEEGWDSALQEAKEAGIPVIIVDRQISVKDDSLYTAWVGADFRTEGDRAVGWLSTVLASQKGFINFAHIQGTTGATAQIGRTEALKDGIVNHNRWVLLAREDADFVQAKGREVMEDFLKRYGSRINVCYCENDNEAYGALQAISAAGYRAGQDIDQGEILVVSFDATRQGLRYTMDGSISMNMECNPLFGPKLTEVVKALNRGEAVNRITYMEEQQFVHDDALQSFRYDGNAYPLTTVTEDVLAGRKY